MTPEQLKASILQYAIQGKLVEQRPEEGTAEELYQELQKEKQLLIKAGQLKKQKKLPEITEEEIPFDIPDTWKWIRLGEIVQVIGGISYDKKDVSKEGVRILRGGNIQSTAVIPAADDVFLPSDYYDETKQVKIGDIVYVASTGSKAVIGKPGFIDEELPQTLIGAFLRICRPISTAYANYLKIIFSSEYYRKHIRDLAQGTNINNVKESYVTELAIPLPPLNEQQRIYSKYCNFIPCVECYSEVYEQLNDLNSKFPEEMKKSILQYAIMGKLVEQRAEEGTAEELYQQIQDEKQKLIRTGKFKKDKAFSDITDDEMPFDIPDNWKWVRVGDIFNVGTGMTPTKSESRFYLGGTIPWVNSSLTSNRYIEHVDTMITQYALDNTSLRLYPAHTLIVAMYGQGKTRGQISELLLPATTNQACAALESYSYQEVTTKYVYYCFLFNYEKLRKRAEGTSQPNLNVQKIKETIIPFPPLGEQQRIVAKIEELLPYCEILSKCKQ